MEPSHSSSAIVKVDDVLSQKDDLFWDHQNFRRRLYGIRGMVQHFENIFRENRMENDPPCQTIPITILEDFDSEVLNAVVRYIYTGDVDLIKFTILSEILEASKFYKIPGFFTKYFEFHRSNLSCKNWSTYLTELVKNQMIDKYPDFLTAIFELVKTIDLDSSIEFLSLNKADLIVMLSAVNRPFDSLKTAFKSIAKWAAYSPAERSAFIDELFDIVSNSKCDNEVVVPKEEPPSSTQDNDNNNDINTSQVANGFLDHNPGQSGQSPTTSTSTTKKIGGGPPKGRSRNHGGGKNNKMTIKAEKPGQSQSPSTAIVSGSRGRQSQSPSQLGQNHKMTLKTEESGQNSNSSTSKSTVCPVNYGPNQLDKSKIISKSEKPGQNSNSSTLKSTVCPAKSGSNQEDKSENPGQSSSTTTSSTFTGKTSPSTSNGQHDGENDSKMTLKTDEIPGKSGGKKRRKSRGKTCWSKPKRPAVFSALKIKKEKVDESEDNNDSDSDQGQGQGQEIQQKRSIKQEIVAQIDHQRSIKQELVDQIAQIHQQVDQIVDQNDPIDDDCVIELLSIGSKGYHQRKYRWSSSELFFFLSKDGYECCMSYNFGTKVSSRAGLICTRGLENMSLVSSMSKVYCIGGRLRTGGDTASRNTVKSILIEDFGKARKPWSEEPTMLESRANCAAILIGNVIWVFGGDKNGDDVTNSIEKLDLSKTRSSWVENEDHMEFSNEKLGVCLLGNRIYMIGGNGSKDSAGMLQPMNFADSYDLVGKQFVPIEYMQEARQDVQVVACRKKIYAIGGTNLERDLATVEVYDPSENKWSFVPPCPIVVSRACAFNLDEVIIYIGKNIFGKPTIQSYNPESGNWTVLPNNLPEGADLSSCALIIK